DLEGSRAYEAKLGTRRFGVRTLWNATRETCESTAFHSGAHTCRHPNRIAGLGHCCVNEDCGTPELHRKRGVGSSSDSRIEYNRDWRARANKLDQMRI